MRNDSRASVHDAFHPPGIFAMYTLPGVLSRKRAVSPVGTELEHAAGRPFNSANWNSLQNAQNAANQSKQAGSGHWETSLLGQPMWVEDNPWGY